MNQKIELTPEEFGMVADIVNNFIQKGAVLDRPKMVVLMGPIASGKTTIRRTKYSEGYVLVDSGELFDVFKVAGADEEKLEGLIMVSGIELVRRAVAEKKNIIIEIAADTSEKSEKLEQIVEKMKSFGYDVAIEYVDCDAEECQKRNQKGRDNVSSYYSTDETLHYFLIYFAN